MLVSAKHLSPQERDNAQKICSLIRRVAPVIPLLVIGRHADTAIRVKLFQADVDDYILIPFDSAELIARIRSAVGRSKKVS